jgi:pimeloyl-ACP methyl ester carboxylesterase
MRRALRLSTLGIVLSILAVPATALDGISMWDQVEHHFAENNGVKLHYVTLGKGETVLFLHGFPDFWYTWRDQMAALSSDFRTAAMDLRGYNQSDQPVGVENYRIPLILDDVAAVIRGLGVEKVTLVGHDWGGGIAWRFAMTHPERVERLIILNLTHPRGYANVLANATDAQRANTEYARRFATSEPKGDPVPAGILAMNDRHGPVVGARFREAFGRSSYDGMLNYYRANYGQATAAGAPEIPDLPMPVLQFHGLKDTAVDKDGLENTWDWIDSDYTLVTVPTSGHWVQAEASELVSSTMKAWLLARTR